MRTLPATRIVSWIAAGMALGLCGGCAREASDVASWSVVAREHRSLKDETPERRPTKLAEPVRWTAPDVKRSPRGSPPSREPGSAAVPVSTAKPAGVSPQAPITVPLQTPPTAPSPDAAKEACNNAEACLAELRELVDNPTRDWIFKPTSPQHYASGSRLYAFRTLRKSLSCKELAAALAEIADADRKLQAPVAGVSDDQAARILTINSVATKELKSELDARC